MNYLPFLALSDVLLTFILLLKALLVELLLSSIPPEKNILANATLACPAKQISTQERTIRFDTDAKQIRVDNRCSACISPYIGHFIGPIEDTNKTIKGFAGARTNNPKSAHFTGSGQMILGRYTPLRSPIHTTSHHAN